ncbi:MAG: hypothetical protein PHH16_04700 [Candidatus Gracilibacteria bacterium]|nr:hypothetical protein [Candidatus Gracilibacteria bacterium]
MFNKNDKIHKRSIKKIDAMVTGMLLGGVVASIYGIKKTTGHLDEKQKQQRAAKKDRIKKILKMLVFGCPDPVTVEKKKGIFSRLFKK